MPAPIGRLKQRSEFLRVARTGRKWATPGVVVQAAPRQPGMAGGEGLRFGLTASKKVGNAVARNRARRRLRAAAGEVLPGCGRPDSDYVLIARRSTLSRPFGKLKDDLEIAIGRVATGRRDARR